MIPISLPVRGMAPFLFAAFAVFLFCLPSSAQETEYENDNIRLPKRDFRSPGEYDTVAYKIGQELAKGSAGLLEREIDPRTYILGPNDVLTVSIMTSKPLEHSMRVSPEGKVLIPGVGIVDVRYRSLHEADSLIVMATKKIYRSAEVAVILSKLRTFKVVVLGQVRKPSTVEATAADRVSEVIERAGGLRFNSSLRRIKVLRYLDDTASINLDVDLQSFYRFADQENNPTLQGGDRVFVPVAFDRKIVDVRGSVPYPGRYEFIEGDKLSTMLRFAGGLAPSAFLDSVELGRITGNDGQIDRVFLDLNNWESNLIVDMDLPNDIPLEAGDRINVRAKPNWLSTETVVVEGEVRYPGRYPISRNAVHLRELINRTGGFTNNALLEGAVVVRRSDFGEIDKEFVRLSKLDPSEMSDDELKYYRARAREEEGLMAVDFELLYSEDQDENNIILQDQDSIYVPARKDYINILGRVNSPGRVVYQPNLTYSDYIVLAGGYGYRADEGGTLVIKSKGEQFLADDFNYKLEPGDRILVPEEPETEFIDVFSDALTIATQLFTIAAVVVSIAR